MYALSYKQRSRTNAFTMQSGPQNLLVEVAAWRAARSASHSLTGDKPMTKRGPYMFFIALWLYLVSGWRQVVYNFIFPSHCKSNKF